MCRKCYSWVQDVARGRVPASNAHEPEFNSQFWKTKTCFIMKQAETFDL